MKYLLFEETSNLQRYSAGFFLAKAYPPTTTTKTPHQWALAAHAAIVGECTIEWTVGGCADVGATYIRSTQRCTVFAPKRTNGLASAATSMGVFPARSLTRGFAPATSKTSAMRIWPPRTAMCSAEIPTLLFGINDPLTGPRAGGVGAGESCGTLLVSVGRRLVWTSKNKMNMEPGCG